jgi:hypothetical protein
VARTIRCGLANTGVRGLVDDLDVEKFRVVVESESDLTGAVEHWRGKAERMRRSLGIQATEEERQEEEALLGSE